MRRTCATLALFLFFAGCLGAPFEQRTENDPELTAGYFEGDIIVDSSQRNALKSETKRWPDNLVFFYITEEHFSPEHINHILRGLEIIESVSCIRFQRVYSGEGDYVNVTGMDEGCYSNVGYLGGKQGVNFEIYPLDSGCFRLGTIVHEFLHTLGIYHQQSASNRDEYVRIDFDNITKGKESNFNKYDDDYVDDFDVEYDYGSVMHYSATAFSKNGKLTIVPLKENVSIGDIGQRRGLSDKDINKLNTMYRCPRIA